MKYSHCHRLAHTNSGFSLIELMVSMAIGLVIVWASISAYLGAASASKIADAQSRMSEDAQAALTILTQQLRMAGNNPKQANRADDAVAANSSLRNPVYLPPVSDATPSFTVTPSSFAFSAYLIRGCAGTFSNITTAANLDALTCVASNTTQPDSIAVNYEADKFNTIPTSAGLPTDCLGNALTVLTASNLKTIVSGTVTTSVPVTYTMADNRFYIGTSTAIVSPSLYCKGNGGSSTAQPLVENVEDMQLSYGTLDPTGTASTVAGYLRADELISQTLLAALPDASRWQNVVTVRICIVVRSENPVLTDLASASYIKCDGTLETNPPDLRLRRAFSATVGMRN